MTQLTAKSLSLNVREFCHTNRHVCDRRADVTNSDVALLQRELHRLGDQMLALSDQVREYSERVHDVEGQTRSSQVADDEIRQFKNNVRRWIFGSVAAAGTIITLVLTMVERL